MHTVSTWVLYVGFEINGLYILPEGFIFFYNRINIMYFMSGGTISKFWSINNV